MLKKLFAITCCMFLTTMFLTITSCDLIPTGKNPAPSITPETPVDDGSMLIGTWKQIDHPIGWGGTYYQGNHYFSTEYADETYVFHSDMTFSHTIIGTVRKFYSDEERLHEIEPPEYENSTVDYFEGVSGTYTAANGIITMTIAKMTVDGETWIDNPIEFIMGNGGDFYKVSNGTVELTPYSLFDKKAGPENSIVGTWSQEYNLLGEFCRNTYTLNADNSLAYDQVYMGRSRGITRKGTYTQVDDAGTFTYTHRLVNNELQYYEPFWSEDYKLINSSLAILEKPEIFIKQ